MSGWCWFHSPRAISIAGRTLAGVVQPTGTGLGVPALWIDGQIHPVGPQAPLDDHDAPAITQLADGRLLVGHTRHLRTSEVTLVPGDLRDGNLSLAHPIVLDFGRPCTYVNLFAHGDGSVTVITRSHAGNPTMMRVDPATGSRTRAQVLVPWPHPRSSPIHAANYSGRDGGRPYLVFAQEGERIHFAMTPDHPRAYRNGVYYGVIDGDAILDASGSAVANVGASDWDPTRTLTEILPAGQQEVAWVQDLAIVDGIPRIGISLVVKSAEAFGASRDASGLRVEYRVAEIHHDGIALRFAGHGGTPLLASECDYARGLTLSRTDPDSFAIATDVNPQTDRADAPSQGSAGGLFIGTFAEDSRAHFQAVAAAADSVPMRPIFSTPLDDRGHALLWLQGRYRHYTDFSLQLRSMTFSPGSTCLAGRRHLDIQRPIKTTIRMGPRERDAFHAHLAGVDRYLEFGSGGTTLAAIAAGVPEIVSIESDLAFLRALEPLARRRLAAGQRLDLHWGDIGPTGEWGRPIERVDGTPYVMAPQARFDAGWMPDLVLIDGRYRAACLLYLATMATARITVLWDDYLDRPHLHWIEQLLAPVETFGNLALFELRPGHLDDQDAVGAALRRALHQPG